MQGIAGRDKKKFTDKTEKKQRRINNLKPDKTG